MTKVCAQCGFSLTDSDRFCAECGAAAPNHPMGDAVKPDITGTIHSLGTTSDTGPQAPVEPHDLTTVEPGSHVLLIVRGPASGTRIEMVGDRMTVGRSPESAIFLDDITVSRQHANFDRDGSGWILVDLGSLNGSYVNRKRVDKVALTHGDEIQIGKYRFHYVIGDKSENPE